jgi:uncharacterized membrane protein YfcA
MDSLYMLFPVSGVRTWVFIPPLIAFVISFFTSMGGISGAFLLLPFQMSFLNFTTPSVSSTNFVYNIFAIPSGVYRYIKEARMAWPLTWVIILGTLPGIIIGYYLRVLYLPDPNTFKVFVGSVLLYVGIRLIYEISCKYSDKSDKSDSLDEKFNERVRQLKVQQNTRVVSGLPPEAVVKTIKLSLKRIEYEFWGERFSFNPISMFLLALFVGIISGTYGIGGGAIIAPFCVAVFHLPIYTIAGASLMGTFITSIVGVIVYSIIPSRDGLSTSPDWLLGFLFGIGGFAGMYLGARFQKFVPQRFIKLILGLIIVFLSVQYISQYFIK